MRQRVRKKGKRPVILFGAGMVVSIHWLPGIARSAPFKLSGVVDPDKGAQARAVKAAPGIWTAAHIDTVPLAAWKGAVAFIATPDHLPVMRELAEKGFREFVVEKPLVTRYAEVDVLEAYAKKKKLAVYSIDHYYPKFWPLEFVLGRLARNDPRVGFLEFHGDHRREEVPGLLGAVEGVTYTNIEAGDLGIPTLDNRPWLEHDPELGGMLRDLGTHAFAPLIRLGLLSPEAAIMDVGLLKFNAARDGFVPVRSEKDVEMWVRALLTWKGITANVVFGKAPFPGKERSLAVRATGGVFFAGLARGQSSVLMTSDGRTTRISLRKSESDLVLEEAIAFFNGDLPRNFDGNLRVSLDALRLNQKLRTQYLENIVT